MNERIELPAGMQPEAGAAGTGLHRMWDPIREAIAGGLIPGASAAVLWRGRTFRYAAGLAVDTPGSTVPARLDTIYDCASLTKVAVTLPLILLLAGTGKLGLDDRLAAYFPEFAADEKRQITIRQLLAHTSGLPSGADFHTKRWTTPEIVAYLASRPLAYPTGTGRIYSDLGFILLGELAVKATGMPLDEAARQLLWEPLGLSESRFCPPQELRECIAATEYDAGTGSCWHGIVHDENARARGGVSGHAGLFATAADLLRYAGLWLEGAGPPPDADACGYPRPRMAELPDTPPPSETGASAGKAGPLLPRRQAILPGALAAEALQTQTPPLPGVNRGLGWVLKGDDADITGSLSTPRAFGHTGFTGTSLMVDPGRGLAAVLLTNRVHYGRDRDIGRLRRDFHDSIARALTGDASHLLRD